MSGGVYVLGVDIGDSSVKAATCRPDGTSAAEPLGEPVIGGARLVSRMGSVAPLCLAGRTVTAPDALADLVRQAATLAEERLGSRPARTVVTVPPSWGAYRRGLLAASLAATVDGSCALVSGAVAAAREHMASGRLPAGVTVLVADLGASTLDAAVVEADPDGGLDHAAVPTSPLAWGGRDADDAVLAHLRRCLGESAVSDAGRAGALRRAAVAIKEALSTHTAIDVPSTVSGSPVPTRLTREELEELLDPGVRSVVDAAADAVAATGLAGPALHGIVLAGGAARMPLVAERLSARFGLPLLVDDDPALTAARGAARLGADALLSEAADSPPAEMAAAGTPPSRSAWGRRAGRTRHDGRVGDRTGPRDGRPPRPRRAAAGRRAARAGTVAGFLLLLVLLPWGLLGLLDRSATSTAGNEPVALAGTPTPGAGATSAAGPQVTTSARAVDESTSVARQAARAGSPSTAAPQHRTAPGASAGGTAPSVAPSAAAGPAVATATTGAAPAATDSAPTQSTPSPEPPPPAADPPPVTTTPPDPAPVTDPPPDPAPVTTPAAGPTATTAADPAPQAKPAP